MKIWNTIFKYITLLEHGWKTWVYLWGSVQYKSHSSRWFLNWTFKIVNRTKIFHSLITHCNIEVTHGYDVVINFAILTKGPFKNDITGVGGGRYPKLVTKSDIGGRGVHAISDITTKKNSLEVFIFHLFLARAAAAELWLAFRWWCCFKHWPESQHSGEIKLDLHLVKCVCFGLECV